MNKEVAVSFGATRLANGLVAEVNPVVHNKGVIPGETAMHEAAHALLLVLNGRGFRRASRIPGSGYLGITEPYEFDAVAAMGPDSLGHKGTGWDRRLVAMHGHDLGTASAVARSILVNNERKLHVLAQEIEVKGEISGYEAEEALRRDAHPEAAIRIIGFAGENRGFVARVREVDGLIPLVITQSPDERRN